MTIQSRIGCPFSEQIWYTACQMNSCALLFFVCFFVKAQLFTLTTWDCAGGPNKASCQAPQKAHKCCTLLHHCDTESPTKCVIHREQQQQQSITSCRLRATDRNWGAVARQQMRGVTSTNRTGPCQILHFNSIVIRKQLVWIYSYRRTYKLRGAHHSNRSRL